MIRIISFRWKISNKYQKKYSSTAKIECEVTQESILGPLLFLYYARDMQQAVDCDLFLHADDS